jgi:hypothetical protein
MRIIIEFILGLFRARKLPHPKETENKNHTADNISVSAFVEMWLIKWDVPPQYWPFWQTQQVKLDDSIGYPAWNCGGLLSVRPSWCSAGVLAHEFAHTVWAELTEDLRTQFELQSTPLIKSDPLVRLLFSQNSYGLTSMIERHAEIYRYLGQQMPECLKRYYPKLIGG